MGTLLSIHRDIIRLIYSKYLEQYDREFLLRSVGIFILEDDDLVNLVLINGHVNRAKYLLVERGGVLRYNACSIAAKGGHIDMLRYLRYKGYNWCNDTCSRAAEYGHIETLRWLKEEGCRFDSWVHLKAAENGHLDIIKYIGLENINDVTELSCFAAQGGHIEILEWLENNNVLVFNGVLFSAAVKSKKIETMDWLLKKNCPMSPGACALASLFGDLKTLKWLRSNGCPWDKWTYIYSGNPNLKELTNWIVENGCPQN